MLFFRRTVLLGGMGAAGVMNVVLLNYCYDVPVKLLSTHLFLMALFLLVPDAGRLWAVLVMNRAVEPVHERSDPLTIPRFHNWAIPSSP